MAFLSPAFTLLLIKDWRRLANDFLPGLFAFAPFSHASRLHRRPAGRRAVSPNI